MCLKHFMFWKKSIRTELIGWRSWSFLLYLCNYPFMVSKLQEKQLCISIYLLQMVLFWSRTNFLKKKKSSITLRQKYSRVLLTNFTFYSNHYQRIYISFLSSSEWHRHWNNFTRSSNCSGRMPFSTEGYSCSLKMALPPCLHKIRNTKHIFKPLFESFRTWMQQENVFLQRSDAVHQVFWHGRRYFCRLLGVIRLFTVNQNKCFYRTLLKSFKSKIVHLIWEFIFVEFNRLNI